MFIEKLLLLISFTIPVFVTLLMWPSKKNFVFVQLFPFYLIAYVGGVFFLFNYSVLIHHIPISNIFYLSYVMIIGAFFYALSFYLTYTSKVSWKNITEKKLEYYIQKAQNPDLWPRIERKLKFAVLILSIIAIVFFIYSYIKMGFVPMFTPNPMEAKYFAGKYQELYRPVAPFFRLALTINTIVTPFLIIFIFKEKKIKKKILFIFIYLILFLLVLVTLRRWYLAFPIITVALIFFSYYKNGKYALPFAIFYIIFFTIGSGIIDFILFFFGLSHFPNIIQIVAGAPDVADLLWFWDSFIKTNYEYSYGRTIYGGMIPYQYDWNPAVVTKLVIGASKTAASGGFRLPVQIEGYIAFGLIGTIIWSIYYGFIDGMYLKLIRNTFKAKIDNFLVFYLIITIVFIIYKIFRFFIRMFIDATVIMVLSMFIVFWAFKKITLFPSRLKDST